MITVEDTTPPEITVQNEPTELWPPNQTYHTIAIGDFVTDVTDICDANVSLADVVVSSVESDEAEDAQGGGQTVDDILVSASCDAVDLRAERQGRSNGRVYTINVSTADASGNVGTASYEVHVPVSPNGNNEVLDDGAVYTVAGTCENLLASKAQTGRRSSRSAIEMKALGATNGALPREVTLSQNYPNPFNPQTLITFSLPESARIRLVVYDALGRLVKVLADGNLDAGFHEVSFDGANMPSGLYLVRLIAAEKTLTQKMHLVK